MALTIPPPSLTQEGATGASFQAAKPIKLACGPVTFPDGTPLTLENVVTFGFRLYRQGAGSASEVWNEETKSWVAESAAPNPQPLFYQEDKWQSILVAVGQKDEATNQNKFGTDPLTGFPKYFVRCFFGGKDAQGGEHSGESAVSPAVQVIDLSERFKAGLAMSPANPAEATEVRLFLKDAGLSAERGKIRIYEVAGGFEIELATVSGARIAITQDGGIVLQPAAGQIVSVQGALTATGEIHASNFP